MAMQTLAIIILCFIGLCLLIALFIFVFFWGKHTVRDNPNKAAIFIKTGQHLSKPYKGNLIAENKQGFLFSFENDFVMVPRSYEMDYHKGKRLIFIDAKARLIACPFNNDTSLDDNDKGTLIYELVASKIGADGMKALRGKPTMNIIVIAIIAFIIGGAIVGFYNYAQQKQSIPQSAPITSHAPVINSDNFSQNIREIK